MGPKYPALRNFKSYLSSCPDNPKSSLIHSPIVFYLHTDTIIIDSLIHYDVSTYIYLKDSIHIHTHFTYICSTRYSVQAVNVIAAYGYIVDDTSNYNVNIYRHIAQYIAV